MKVSLPLRAWRGHAFRIELPPPPVVENLGVVLGEVEAYRAWKLFDGFLLSVAVERIWMPGAPMTAANVTEHGTSGVHAFKTVDGALDYAHCHCDDSDFAIGRVKLWGQIIEHEIGYRAEFAKPLEILSIHERNIMPRWSWVADKINARYGIRCRS